MLGTAEQCARLLERGAGEVAAGEARPPSRRRWPRVRAAGGKAARLRPSACTSRSTRAPSASSSSPTSAGSSGAARRAGARVPRRGRRGVGQAADDERLDADRGGAARPRLPGVAREGDADPRPHRRPARAPRRGAASNPIGFLMAASAEEAIAYEPRPTTDADARARGRDAPVGRAARARRRELSRRRSPICSSARRSTARSSARRASLAGEAGGLAEIAQLPLTEKDELRASRTPENPIGAHLCADARRRSCASTRRAAPPARRATSRSPRATSTTGSRARRAAMPPRASPPAQRIVSTYNAGPVRRRRGAGGVRPPRALPHPGRHRQHRAAACARSSCCGPRRPC